MPRLLISRRAGLMDGYLATQFCPAGFALMNHELAAEGLRAIAHDVKTEAFAAPAGCETFAVVFNAHADEVLVLIERDQNIFRTRMFDRVLHRLLRNAIE